MRFLNLPLAFVTTCLLASGCGSEGGSSDTDGGTSSGDGGTSSADSAPARLAPELGSGDNSPSSVNFTTIAAGTSANLNEPRDLAFNPMRPDELWVVNYADDSVTLVHDASKDTRRVEYRKDGYALHFMAEVTTLAFGQDTTTAGVGKPGTFATCGESRNHYDMMATPNDFMGPALWSSDLTIFAKMNPGGLGAHLDMLHYTPNCMGIAHESANVYWVFGALRNEISRYDFGLDDGIGNDDHSDGRYRRYAQGVVRGVPGVPSHLAFDPTSKLLYIADSGNQRIAKLDTLSGVVDRNLTATNSNFERIAEFSTMKEVAITDVVPQASGLLDTPSGLELRNNFLYVSDNRTGRISAFTLEGELVNHLDTGLGAGSLGGLAFGPDNKLYFVDMLADKVMRIDPK